MNTPLTALSLPVGHNEARCGRGDKEVCQLLEVFNINGRHFAYVSLEKNEFYIWHITRMSATFNTFLKVGKLARCIESEE